MRTRVCVQSYDNGDVQGYLYIDSDDGAGETLVTTSERYLSGSSNATEFTMSGVKGSVSVAVRINVPGQGASFDVDFVQAGVATSSQFSRTFTVNSNPCN
jgi:hypothetical protein